MPNQHAGVRAHPFLPGAVLLLAPAAAAQLTWTQVTTANAPPALVAPAAAPVPYPARAVLFGGLGASGASGATWVLDAQGWTQVMAAAAPPARSHASMTSVGVNALLFGGRGAQGNALADTWMWSASGSSWIALAAGPAAREAAAMAPCPSLGDAVLFGGRDGATVFADTWTYYVGWTQLALAVAPPARHRHAMAGAGTSLPRDVVLFGGVDAAGVHLDDTWVLRQPLGGAPGWIMMQPATRPSPRAGHAMRYSSHRTRVQLFGGEGPNGLLGDTWEWDGANWIAIATAGAPAARTDAVLVDEPQSLGGSRDGLLLGGRDAGGALAEQWRVAPTAPASAVEFGTVAPGLWVLPPPQQPPWLGSTFQYQVMNFAAPLVAPHLIAGFSNTTSALGPLPLNLGPALNGVTLLVDPAVVLPLPSLGLGATVSLSLPLVPALQGTHLYLQVLAWLPVPGNPRWVVTRGMDCVLGWQ